MSIFQYTPKSSLLPEFVAITTVAPNSLRTPFAPNNERQICVDVRASKPLNTSSKMNIFRLENNPLARACMKNLSSLTRETRNGCHSLFSVAGHQTNSHLGFLSQLHLSHPALLNLHLEHRFSRLGHTIFRQPPNRQ